MGFLSFVVEYLDEKKKRFNVLFCYWLRIHTILLNRGSQYELSLRKQFEKFLENGEKRVLEKQRIVSIEKLEEEFGEEYDQAIIEKLAYQIDILITNDDCVLTGQLLAAILITVAILKKSETFGRCTLSTEVGMILNRYSQSVKKSNSEEQGIIKQVKDFLRDLGGIDEQAYEDPNREITGKRDSKSEVDNTTSINSRFASKRSFPTYQRQINVWEYPLKSNQVHLLYLVSFKLARLIDFILPPKEQKRSESPSRNLRWMATQNSLGCFLALLFMILILF